MQTKVVIVYSPYQNRVRTVYVPDDDREVPGILNAVALQDPRLGTLVAEIGEFRRLGHDEVLKRYLGRPPSPHRCLVVMGNTVVGIVHGDPQLDTHPRGRLIYDTKGTAKVGDHL